MTLPRQTGRTRKTTNKHDETTTYALLRGRTAGRRSACRRRPRRLRSQARRARYAHCRSPDRPCRGSRRPSARGARTRTSLLRTRSRPCVGRAGACPRRTHPRHAARRDIAAGRATACVTDAGARKPRADVCMGRKKARTAGSGLIHLRRRVEETFGGCRSATTNEAHYTNAPPTSQENLHYEIKHHNVKFQTINRKNWFPL